MLNLEGILSTLDAQKIFLKHRFLLGSLPYFFHFYEVARYTDRREGRCTGS